MIIKHPYWSLYSADDNGSVYGQSNNLLKPINHHTGYIVYTIRQHGKMKQVRSHRFIWECHKGNIPDGKVINHLDGDKTNNQLENLEVVSQRRNATHAFELGLRTGGSGENNSMSKITNEQFIEVVKMFKDGHTNRTIGNRYGLHPNYVSLIRHKKRWRKAWESISN